MLGSLKLADVYRNSVDVGVLVIDPVGTIQFANKVISQFRGVSSEELQGKSYHTLLPVNPETVQQLEDLVHGRSDELAVSRAHWQGPDQVSYIKGYAQYQNIDNCGNCRVIFLRDVSEEVLFREHLRQQALILENVRDSIIVVDQQGVITYWNEAATELYGHSSDEMIGQLMQHLNPEFDIEQFMRYAQQDEAFSYRGDWSYQRSDDKTVWADVKVSTLYEQGRLSGAIAVSTDITEKKEQEQQLRRKERELSTIVNSQTNYLIRTDPEGNYTYANPAYLRKFTHQADLIGKPVYPTMHPADVEIFASAIQEAVSHSGKTTAVEVRKSAPDESTYWLTYWEIVAITDSADQSPEILAIGYDITHRKENEVKVDYLRRFNRLLLEISTTFINLNYAELNEKINEALQAVTDFTDFERSYVYLFNEDKSLGTLEFEYCKPKAPPTSSRAQTFPAEPFPWWMNQILAGKAVQIPVAEELPEEAVNEKQVLQQENIKSTVAVPILYQGEALGYIGFACLSNYTAWSEESIELLILLGAIFANSLSRARTEQVLKQNNKALEDSQASLALAQQISKLGSYEFHLSDRSFELSDEFYRIFGLDPQSVTEEVDVFQYIHPEDIEYVRKATDLAFKRKKSEPVSFRIIDENSKLKYVNSYSQFFVNEQGEAKKLIGAIQDISHLRELERMLQETGQIAKVGGWEVDLLQSKVIFTPETYRIFDLPIGTEPKLDEADKYFHPDDMPTIKKMLYDLQYNGEACQEEMRFITATGEEKWIRASGEVYERKDNQVSKIRGFIQDITESKERDEIVARYSERLTLAVQTARIGIWELDAATEKLYWNDELLEIYGITREQFEERYDHWRDMVHPDDIAVAEKEIKKARMGESVFNVEYRIIRPDGELRYINASVQPVSNEKGEIIRIVGVNLDITYLKRNQEALKEYSERFTTATEQAEIGIWDHNLVTDKLIWSDQMFEIFGAEKDDFGFHLRDWINCVHPEDVGWLLPELKERAESTEKTYEAEYRIVRQCDKKVRYIKVVGKVFRENGKMVRAVGTNWDITDVVKYEKSLIKKNRELQKANTELDHFVYSTSHNLRAPLTSIMGIVELLRETTTEAERNHYIELINESIHKLDETIQEISDYSKNSRIEVVCEQIDLKKLFEETYRSLSFMDHADKIKIDVLVHEKLIFHSDPNRLKIIFNNLLSNAIKYCNPEQDKPFLQFTAQQDNSTVKMVFTDNGIGIKPQYLNRVFNMFFRATAQVSGSGLGLYIVKEAVDRLHGTIHLQSELGEGTTFTIVLPNLAEKAN